MIENDQLQVHSDWNEYNEQKMTDTSKIHEILMSQQQQLNDISTILLSVMEIMQQKFSPPPDYQQYFVQIENRLQAVSNQNQSTQKLLKDQEGNTKPLDQLGDSLKVMKKTLNTQSTTLQGLFGWRMIAQITLFTASSGLGLLIGSYFLTIPSHNALEKKLDQLNTRNEQIWKKVK
jgi:hypothetical protein